MKVNPINMRLYRRFDADLIAIHESGIPVNVIAECLLDAYAQGKRVKIIPEGCEPFDVGKRKSIHLTVNVRSKEAKELISQIKRGYRNQFAKSLLRDALETIAVWVYFSDERYVSEENKRIQDNQEGVIVLPPGLRRKDYRNLINGDKVKTRKKKDKKQTTKPASNKTPLVEKEPDNRTDTPKQHEEDRKERPPVPIPFNLEGWDTEETEPVETREATTENNTEDTNKTATTEEDTVVDDAQDFYDAFDSLF